jgi:hypothetical protein
VKEENMSRDKNRRQGIHWRLHLRIMMALILIELLASGCAYMEFWSKKRELRTALKENPSVTLLRELTPENVYGIYGRFDGYGQRKEPLLIVTVSREHGNEPHPVRARHRVFPRSSPRHL